MSWIFSPSLPAQTNPYLPKPGERPTKLRIATCAVSGGFVHLYTAIENRLFEKYGLNVDHVFIRGSRSALAALLSDEIQFLYCAADATLPSLAAGADAKLIAAPLVKLPYLLVTRKEIRRVEDLRGKILGVGRAGDLSDRLSRILVKKFNVSDVTIKPVGGSQSERYQAMVANLVQGVVVTPPLDVRAKHEGFNVAYRLIDLDIPFIYSSLHTSSRAVYEKPELVQRMVAGFAEAIAFADRNPARTKAAMAKYMRVKEEEPLQAAYNVYTKEIVDRRMIVPATVVNDTIELLRNQGIVIKRRPEEIYDNSFAEHLDKSGFLKSLWGK